MSVDVELENLIRARYPLIYIVSWEEKRVEESIREVCQKRGKKMVVWTFTTGMAGNLATKDPIAALDYVINAPDQTVFVLKDFHPFIGDVAVTRRLRDLVYALKQSYKTVVLLSPLLKLPPELEKEITVVDYQLPTIADLDRLLESIIQSVRGDNRIDVTLTPLEREQVLQSASGLTSIEAENVFAKSLVEKRRFDIDVILGEKEQIIRKSGILEYYRASDSFADVGGMDLLKKWMEQRTTSFNEDAKKYGLPEPKGILLLGVQGCGKSLIAKTIASLWRLPLLRLDVGKIFAGIVGSSEENMRKAIATAESVAPCILWLDELEKGFAGTQSSASDGG
ncbi:MAG: AAA family ATPase, partial [Armatimonadetes bacterium]|nr:AAA family ATPase [Armatimonadota bacterium]